MRIENCLGNAGIMSSKCFYSSSGINIKQTNCFIISTSDNVILKTMIKTRIARKIWFLLVLDETVQCMHLPRELCSWKHNLNAQHPKPKQTLSDCKIRRINAYPDFTIACCTGNKRTLCVWINIPNSGPMPRKSFRKASVFRFPNPKWKKKKPLENEFRNEKLCWRPNIKTQK